VNGDGVVDLLVTNPASDAAAEFVVTNPETFIASVIDVAPSSSLFVTVDGLADGAVVVPVQFNGNDASVSTQISCDPLTCPEGAPTTVTDDNGVQHEACVESAAAAPVVPAPAAAAAPVAPKRSSLTQTVPTTSPGQLPKTGAGTGGLIIAALLVGSGSVASLLSRRKADRS
jgi:LPXTG-motif cell wall-anchored protein